ncbi:XdhC family protein [Pelagibius marinus]|uniref:XdhC family protein n=1 Tax=Pelagibius marinus TaxID=2762760 RepID=UPI0018725D55|nr:XdhC family protein [Pelagibius marinus]
MKREILDRLQKARAAKQPTALVTDLTDGRQLLQADGDNLGELSLDAGQQAAVTAAITADRSGPLPEHPNLFVHVYNPPLRLLVVGAVHISQALVPMAQVAGYEVIIIDPRKAWANAERFPSVQLIDDWPDDAMTALAPDHRSAVVVLTHDPKLDDPALGVVLRSPAFYVGALGSRKTHAKRIERLREQGLGDDEISRIHAPIGLAIGAKSPAEIAISIMAQITQVLHGVPPLVKAGQPEAAPREMVG